MSSYFWLCLKSEHSFHCYLKLLSAMAPIWPPTWAVIHFRCRSHCGEFQTNSYSSFNRELISKPPFWLYFFEGFHSIQIIQKDILWPSFLNTSYLATKFSSLHVSCRLESESFGLSSHRPKISEAFYTKSVVTGPEPEPKLKATN